MAPLDSTFYSSSLSYIKDGGSDVEENETTFEEMDDTDDEEQPFETSTNYSTPFGRYSECPKIENLDRVRRKLFDEDLDRVRRKLFDCEDSDYDYDSDVTFLN